MAKATSLSFPGSIGIYSYGGDVFDRRYPPTKVFYEHTPALQRCCIKLVAILRIANALCVLLVSDLWFIIGPDTFSETL